MKYLLSLLASVAVLPAGALAGDAASQDDCIENIIGLTVCGEQAQAVRARLEAEAASEAGRAEKHRKKRSSKNSFEGSAYSLFRNTVSLRSGYIFDTRGSLDEKGYSGGLAYTRRLNDGPLAVKSDIELYGADLDSFDGGVGAIITSVILAYEPGRIQPFISAGMGYSGIFTSAGDVDAFVYQGRGGVNLALTQRFGLESAYRYLGFVNGNGRSAMHGAEVNLNVNF